ncbi:hypothetical protein ISX56_34275, partial [Serratia ureilytica]|nr:hypothetical protein [Serratia ureilytica]
MHPPGVAARGAERAGDPCGSLLLDAGKSVLAQALARQVSDSGGYVAITD